MSAARIINDGFFNLIKVTLLILVAIFSVWLTQISEPLLDTRESPPRHEVDYFAENFTATLMDAEGKPHYSLRSDYLEHFPDDNSTNLRNPYLTLFQKGIPYWFVTSKQGRVSAEGETVWLSEQVRIYRPPELEAWTLDTSEMLLYPKRQYGETNRAVEIRRPRQKMNAVGMHAYLKERRVEFLNHVRIQLLPLDR